MKTLTLETCKRLAEEGLLEEKGFDNYMCPDTWTCKSIEAIEEHYYWNTENLLGAPNLEEALELLPLFTHLRQIRWWEWLCDNKNLWIVNQNIWGKSHLEAVEKMINHLLDKKLLWQKQ